MITPYSAVALFTRAWIEIHSVLVRQSKITGRPLYEGVDWNFDRNACRVCKRWSPSLRGRGLKCPHLFGDEVAHIRRPLYEGVDWNQTGVVTYKFGACRPLYEGVDWNQTGVVTYKFVALSPSLRGRGLKWGILKLVGEEKKSRPLYEGVDWNGKSRSEWEALIGRPLYEGVDWNVNFFIDKALRTGRPLYEGVDWNDRIKK